MAYISKAELKGYQGITLTGDDTLIDALIAAAQNYIEKRTGRVFEASDDTIRYLNAAKNVEGAKLYLDRDLCAITTIVNNADGTTPETLSSTTDYITVPRNDTPYYALKLKAQSGKYWRYTYDPEEGIKITGKWAYSTTPPAAIVQACKRLVGYYYKLKDAQVFDITALPEQGAIMIPKGVPADVELMLKPFIKVVV